MHEGEICHECHEVMSRPEWHCCAHIENGEGVPVMYRENLESKEFGVKYRHRKGDNTDNGYIQHIYFENDNRDIVLSHAWDLDVIRVLFSIKHKQNYAMKNDSIS